MNQEQIAKLKRAINCLEILDKRPRPMCRDCADEDGTCPNDGLDCDMRKLIADTRAILAERTTAPVSLTDEGIIAYAAEIFDFKPHKQGEEQKAKWITFARAILAAAPAPIQQEPVADNTSAWTALQEIIETKVTAENPEAFRLKMIAVDAFTGRISPARVDTVGGDAARDVLAERERQKQQEGWTDEHDDQYEDGELCCAAACYTMANDSAQHEESPNLWPWPEDWWKPTTERRNLVKAGALILAEIERLDRAAMREQP